MTILQVYYSVFGHEKIRIDEIVSSTNWRIYTLRLNYENIYNKSHLPV